MNEGCTFSHWDNNYSQGANITYCGEDVLIKANGMNSQCIMCILCTRIPCIRPWYISNKNVMNDFLFGLFMFGNIFFLFLFISSNVCRLFEDVPCLRIEMRFRIQDSVQWQEKCYFDSFVLSKLGTSAKLYISIELPAFEAAAAQFARSFTSLFSFVKWTLNQSRMLFCFIFHCYICLSIEFTRIEKGHGGPCTKYQHPAVIRTSHKMHFTPTM